MTTAVGK